MTRNERLRQIAAVWSVRHPRLQTRLFRAVEVTEGVRSQGEGVYVVKGSSEEYIVAVNHERGSSICTCKDHQRGNHCKHRLAVALVYVYETEQAAK